MPFVETPYAPAPPARNVNRPTPRLIKLTAPAAAPALASPAEATVSNGSGFFASGDGNFVAAAQVVEGCETVRVKTNDGPVEEAKVVAKDTANDLAILKLSKGSSKFAS